MPPSVPMIAVALSSAWLLAYLGPVLTALWPPREARPNEPRPFALLRPLSGDESGLGERLCASGGAERIVFAIGSEDDGARPAAETAVRVLRARGVAASLVVTHAVGPNHKTDQLARAQALAALAEPVIVVADSDVDLRDDDLTRLAAAVGAGCAAAWALPIEVGPIRTNGDAASHAVLGASLHSFPLLSRLDPRGLVGKLFAVERAELAAVGGFEALRGYLGEDMELARRLRARGLHTTAISLRARSAAEGRSLPDVIARFARWLLVVRLQRPVRLLSYPLLLAPAPLFALAFAIALARNEPRVAVLFGLAIALRWLVACAARRACGRPVRPLVALGQAFLADAVLLAAFFRACTARSVRWRGRTFTPSGKKGREHALGEPAERAGATGVECTEGRPLAIDRGELPLDRGLLGEDVALHPLVRAEGRAEREPEIRGLARAEHVPHPDGHDDRATRHLRDLRRPREELELLERRLLAALRKYPYETTGSVEQLRGVPDRARAVRRIGEVHAERSYAPEERDPPKVRRVHQRVPVRPEQPLRRVERDQRVPPRGVIRDDEDRVPRESGTRLVEPAHEHAPERLLDAPLRMPGEPGVEPLALLRGDHEAS